MIKIAIDCRMIGSGGIGSYISELIPFFLKENECLLIGTHEQCMKFLRLENVEFCYCDVKPFSMKELFSFPSECLNKINQYDVYYSPYCNIPGGITIPVFTTIHDIVFLDVPGIASGFGTFGRKLFYKRASSLSKILFTVSEFSKERILKKLHPSCPVIVTYNAAPAYLSEPFENQPEKTKTILFVGNIKKHKGLKILLDAFESAVLKGLSSQLIIVGNKNNFRTGDEETAKRLMNASPDKIKFTGKISDEELKLLYAQAQLLVQPSFYEGFGMPPLEAMTVGTPALISDIPVFKEIYAKYPVTFFKSGDASDLESKMTALCASSTQKVSIPAEYSFAKTAEIILSSMRHCL